MKVKQKPEANAYIKKNYGLPLLKQQLAWQQNQISSPRYSDISSQYLHQARAAPTSIIQLPSDTSLQNIHHNPPNPPNPPNPYDIDNQHIKLDTEQFMSYFADDDSFLSLGELFPEEEFRGNARELGIGAAERETIAYKFYRRGKGKEMGRGGGGDMYSNNYYVQYLQWKNKQGQHQKVVQKPQQSSKSKQQQQIAKQKLLKKQLQYQKLKQKQHQQNQQKSYKQMKNKLQHIKEQYQHKLNHILSNKWEDLSNREAESARRKYEEYKQEIVMEKARHLGFQRVEYPELNAVQIRKMEEQAAFNRREEERLKQLNHKSFVNMIRHPPRKYQSDFDQQYLKSQNIAQTVPNSNKNQRQFQKPTNLTSQTPPNPPHPQPSLKLDIPQILQMPPKQFLLFYTTYQHKLAALSTPQQLKKLNKYRQQALQRQQALNKLKEKIAKSGEEVLRKLSKQRRRQLFQLLYEDEVGDEIGKLGELGG